MKTIILILLCQLAYSQQKEQKIYKHTNGIREILPSVIIVDDKEVYKVVHGVKEILPTLIIEDNRVFETTNGIKDVTPILEIETP